MRITCMLRSLMALVIGLIVSYLLLALAAYLLQERIIYVPHQLPHSQTVAWASRVGLELWPGEGDDYYGLVSTAGPPNPKGTVLVWHGNGGSAVDRFFYIAALQPLGYRVVLLEYPGYGSRTGALGEDSFVRDAVAAARQAEETFGGPLYAWGESLGCGVASAVAADPSLDVRGVIMLTPWATLPDLAQHLYPYLPVRWLARDGYDNVENLSTYDRPVAVVMAGQDEIIPNDHTLRLYRSLAEPKKLWVFEDARHNTWPTSPQACWWAEVMAFVSRAATSADARAKH